MDIISKINLLLKDEVSGATTTGDVEQNTAKGKIDVIGGKCPDGMVYDKKKKVCVPVKNESANSPKKGDRFSYKGKKLTITDVGSGIGHDKYISFKYDGEKQERDVKMTNFFKGNDFKYIKESNIKKKLSEYSIVGGSYIDGTTSNIIGSQQTRAGFTTKRNIVDLARKEKVEDNDFHDFTKMNILGRKSLRFNKETGSYEPEFWRKK